MNMSKRKGVISILDNQGRKSDIGVKYKISILQVGFRTLLQSQLTKAGERFEFSIDRLIIFCNFEPSTLNVELVEEFLSSSRLFNKKEILLTMFLCYLK